MQNPNASQQQDTATDALQPSPAQIAAIVEAAYILDAVRR